ncbi:MAG: hypothetical protein M1347_04980 [Chloroflexi bacterium]|nr:hypothetical protein [Chloroflexota bacterium]
MQTKRTKLLERLKPYRVEIFFLLIALLPALYIALGNPNTILDWYSSDDGFLYFQVAKNLAAGHGFTFDGINPTNGFHPLWLFVITPLFALSQINLLLPLRLLIILSALLSAASAILLYRILNRYVSTWVSAFIGLLWIVLPRIHDLTLHTGVEAGINAFFLLLFWHLLVSFKPNPKKLSLRELIALGLLGALAILARLDNAFLVGLGGLWLWLRLWHPSKKAGRQNPWLWRLQTGFAFFGPIAGILALYFAWNLFAFGVAMPISGEVKLWWGTLKNTVYGFPVKDFVDFGGQFFTDDPELGPWSLLTAPLYASAEWLLAASGQSVSVMARRTVLLAMGAMLAALGGVLIWLQREFLRQAARGLGLLPFFLGCFIQIAYYKFAGSVAQQPWYWIAEMIFLLIVLGLLIEALLRVAARALPVGLRRLASGARVALLAVVSLLFLGFIQSAVRAPGDGGNHFYIHRARWLEANTEMGARVAITGAGNLAYFTEGRTIINMDGLMNTHDYLLALQAGEGAQYLANLGVDYIFGNEYILTETNPYAPMLDGHLEPYQVYRFADRELPLWRFIP